MTKLSIPQQTLLAAAQHRRDAAKAQGESRHAIFVQGDTHRTAKSLERMGYGIVQSLTVSRGWFVVNDADPAPKPIKCDMTAECSTPATYLGTKGYVYCAAHREYRRGIEATRPMKRWEIERIMAGKTLLSWDATRERTLAADEAQASRVRAS